LRREFLTTTEEIRAQMEDLAGQINGEREAWKAAAARARTGNFWRGVWVVLGAGVAGYAAGR
jgi:hypothetical protein